jgi:hypothetical protein
MSDIRACRLDDIPVVADIFQRTFRDAHEPAPPALQTVLRELFFEHPWQDPELPSRVSEADGKVNGFIGVLPVHMSFRGRKLRAAVPSSIMVDDPHKHPLAGAKLVRAFLNGPQDLSFSEPISPLAQSMWERMGGESALSESMEWLRVLHPAGLAVAFAAGRVPLLGALSPLARLVDRGLAQRGSFATAPLAAGFHDADVDDESLFGIVSALAETYSLHPDWDPGVLRWQLAHAAGNTTRGALYRRAVHDRSGRPIGCYVYHGRPGQMAWTLLVLARPETVEPVLDSLLAHAAGQGAVALKGRSQLRLLDPLLKRNALFFRRHSAVAHSRDRELLAAIRAGDAVTSGLAAESWTRLIGDSFRQ